MPPIDGRTYGRTQERIGHADNLPAISPMALFSATNISKKFAILLLSSLIIIARWFSTPQSAPGWTNQQIGSLKGYWKFGEYIRFKKLNKIFLNSFRQSFSILGYFSITYFFEFSLHACSFSLILFNFPFTS